MRDARINYAVVGAFVLVMLVAGAVVVALLTGRTGSADTYFTHLNNVTGVKYGTKVTYEGFVVGQVEDIAPLRAEGKTRFRVKVSVREGWGIPADSVARVAASGILAAVAIDIKGGTAEAMLQPGAEIPGGPSANIFAVMNEVAGQVSDLNQNALKPLLATLNLRADALGKVLEQQAPEILANIAAITTDLATKTPRISADVERMTNTLSTKVVNQPNAERIAQSIDNVADLTAGLKESRHKVDAVLTSLDKVVTGNRHEMDAAIKDLRYTLQAVAR
ncbi:MAG TPA: MlaD family protein, partial [Candidatus Omnitrophota bacterium]|nr:MlaD family protein [Candidatus Omnitrophota bacterium]